MIVNSKITHKIDMMMILLLDLKKIKNMESLHHEIKLNNFSVTF